MRLLAVHGIIAPKKPWPVTNGSHVQLSWISIIRGATVVYFSCHSMQMLSTHIGIFGYHLILLFIVDFFDAVVRTTALFTNDVNS